MIENELEYREWCRKNELGDNAIGNYVSWLTTASRRIGEEISSRTLSSESDVERMISQLQRHPDMADINAARAQNTRSAMRQYVAMVTAHQNSLTTILAPQTKCILSEAYSSLQAGGSLTDIESLNYQYKDFQEKFGPDKLKALEGKSLLDCIHARGNNSSLVYVLEFGSEGFGGIKGGAANKFGIYFKQTTQQWITGPSNDPQVITEEEAIHFATRQRNQLILGSTALATLPNCASDDEYAALQAKLKEDAPDIFDKGWAHKYWHMLFPDKLDDYHNEKWQRYHLIKLLHSPPSIEGLYTCAGCFMQIASELDWPITHLTRVLNKIHGNPITYWKIGTQLSGVHSIWQDMLRGKYVAIGWGGTGSLEAYVNDDRPNSQVKSDISNRLLNSQYYTDDQSTRTRKAGEILNFLREADKGDFVIAVEGRTVLGIGVISGAYFYSNTPPEEAYHRRGVKWLSLSPWSLPDDDGPRTCFWSLKKESNILEIEKRLVFNPDDASINSPLPIHQENAETYCVDNAIAEGMFFNKQEVENILGRFKSKKNLILQGAPGVGKTFITKKLAYLLMGEKAEDRIKTVQFHPSYSYEDFVRGYRPTDEAGKFELVDGTFWTFCGAARKQPDKKFVMIIDEINRGNLSQIFGELFMLLEADKRGEEVTPLYRKNENADENFSIPGNVYLIGTMNIADRSLALVDYALRRRFAFVTLEPKFDSEEFKSWLVDKNSCPSRLHTQISSRMIALNKMISDDKTKLGPAFRIGHSFFCNTPESGFNHQWYREVIDTEIIPLLEEYWHDDSSKLDQAIAILR